MLTLEEMNARRPRRSKAWLFYLLLTICAVIAMFSQPAMFFIAALLGLYTRYLYHGGSVVIWFW